MRWFERCNLNAPIQTALDLFFVRLFQHQIDRLFDHLLGLFNRAALAGYSELWARRHKPIVLALDDSGQFGQLHNVQLTTSGARGTPRRFVFPA